MVDRLGTEHKQKQHKCSTDPAAIAAAWADRADELAAWADRVLVNRRDIWGGYYRTRNARGEWVTATMTCPRVADRGRLDLAAAVLLQHFRATRTRDVVGLHTTSRENTSRWGGIDIDKHGDGGNDPAANLAAAVAWYERLRGLGFVPLLTDSNGRGGYHLLVPFTGPVATPRVYAFLRWLTADHARHGLAHAPECFPKQPRIDPGRCGNWLRVCGRHHTRDHWSRAWNGSDWLEGEAAVAHVLALAGSAPDLIPAEAAAPPAPVLHVSLSPAPAGRRRCGGLAARIQAYMSRLPNLALGQGRDDIAYLFSAFLSRDLALPDAVVLEWVQRWDCGNTPPLGRQRLEEILASVHTYARRPLGCGRTDGSVVAEI
jgi:hypothetical protein